MNNVSQILLINKPKHWTSNDVVRKIKKVYQLKKVGHGGTLDPLASGLLIVGCNSGTKKLNEIINSKKTYISTIHFNYYTNTYDSEGEIVKYQYKQINYSDLVNALDWFVKNQYHQKPPKYSAIKINGVKAYELARKNLEVNLPTKLVNLFSYKIISFIDRELVIELNVSKGFYVRSFCYDLGIKLNNYANMANLVRTQIGKYKLLDAINIEELND